MQLEIERAALHKEKDNASKHRLDDLEVELADAQEELNSLLAVWQHEKDLIQRMSGIKADIDEARIQLERAERQGNLEEAARLRYGVLPDLDKTLREREAAIDEMRENGSLMLKEEVDADEVAAIVSRWTGVPVARMLEGEIEKLLRMEDRLHERVVGQDDAIKRGFRCCAPQPSRFARPQSTGPAHSSSWVPPASARRKWRAHWRNFSLMTRAPWRAST